VGLDDESPYATAPDPLVSLGRFDHPPGRTHRDPRQETAPGYSISFLEQRSYQLDVGPRRWDVQPGMALVTGPGATFRVRHSEDRPSDVSLVVGYARRFVEESDHPLLPPLNALSPTNRLGSRRPGGQCRAANNSTTSE
jgi:hypothetical protein